MVTEFLLDVVVSLSIAGCFALLAFGAWLCVDSGKPKDEASDAAKDETRARDPSRAVIE